MVKSIQSGEAAPDFSFTAADGTTQNLYDYLGRKVLLAFFRNAACALCNLRIRNFIMRYEDWRRQGLDIIAVFESPEVNLRDHVGQQQAPFSLVADPEGTIYSLYGVEVSEEKVKATIADPHTHSIVAEAAAAGFLLQKEEGSNFNRIPAEFLINENGIVWLAHYGRLVTDHLPFEQIERFARNEAGDNV